MNNEAKNKIKIGLNFAYEIAIVSIYAKLFSRFERPNYDIRPGIYNIKRANIKRYEVYYHSDGVKLKGYYYPSKNGKALVVCAHGIHSGADDYLPFIKYFVEHNFNVFAFNYKGTYESKGSSTVGMCESLVDLDHTLDYIKQDKKLSKMPLFLFGHSWGGYAVGSVLNYHKNVKGAAIIAGMNSGATIIVEKGNQYAGQILKIPEEIINAYQRSLFGNYVDANCVDGINSTNTSVLIAHGINDNVIDFETQSTLSYKEILRKENVEYYVGYNTQSTHSGILYSEKANNYRKSFEDKIKEKSKVLKRKLNDNELKEIYNDVDHYLYSEVNSELMDKIINMFNKRMDN